jgi:hypothetical protein
MLLKHQTQLVNLLQSHIGYRRALREAMLNINKFLQRKNLGV